MRHLDIVIVLATAMSLTYVVNPFKYRFFTIIHKLTIASLIIACLIYQIPVINYWVNWNSSRNLSSFLQSCKISISWMDYFVNYLATTVMGNAMLTIWQQFHVNNEDLYSKKYLRFSNFVAIFYIAVLSGFQFLSVYATPDERIKNYLSGIMYVFLDCIPIVVVLLFTTGNFYIWRQTKVLETEMLNSRCLNIVTLRRQHMKIFEIVQTWVSWHRWQLLVTLSKNYVELSFALVNVATKLYGNDNGSGFLDLDTVLLIWSAIWNLLLIMNMCISCHITANQFLNLKTIIHTYMKEKAQNSRQKVELRLFMLQAMHIKLEFSIMGIIHLNPALIFKVLTTAITYMTIIFTFGRKIK